MSRGVFSKFDKNNIPIEIVGISQDVTEFEEYRRSLALFYEQSMFGYAYCDMDGVIIEANKKYEEITGYSLDELKKLSYRSNCTVLKLKMF